MKRSHVSGRCLMQALTAAAALAAVLTTAPALPLAQGSESGSFLTIAKTDAYTSRAEKQLRPLAAYLGEQLRDDGVAKVRTVIAADPESLAGGMIDGGIDIVFDSPFPFMAYRRRVQASAILLGSRDGARTTQGHIFVRRDSGIEDLADLRGRIVALENRTSTMEYFFPKLLLQSRGLALVELPSPDSGVPDGKVGYVLAGSQLNISAWVFYGKVAAGALGSAAWEEQEQNPRAYRKEFRILSRTTEAPYLVVAVTDGMDGTLRNRIREELLNMHLTPLGVAALQAAGIDSFAEPGPEAISALAEFVLPETAGPR